MQAIEVRNLTKSFSASSGAKTEALKNVSMAIAPKEIVALVGASGSGKSTLLKLINGLQIADSGRVEIFGTPIQSAGLLHSKVRNLRSQIGFIFQQFNLVNRLTVIENVLIGNLSRVSLGRSLFHWFTHAEKLQALAALERVGILEQAYQRAGRLSGGQQQRVAIARCLMQGATIILADEPVASLDPESARKVMELLLMLNREQEITLVASLHQVQIVRHYFERAIALANGEIKFDGKTVELHDERLNQIYGVSSEELLLS
ncbi:phosphonate ABC transporter ATP-binding protein [Oculatella sp. FACHB-28]|uniref:phosphonate ABC transporter ATP-binding protein n=1 Tax=Cyanophyceae TaxID=3028117 RepID=UPI0016829509|nr:MULTISPECIES: phosphonate ABC transporter ATP-binding protein [Cyanophyceae]MBD1998811.1 phosphonate ABC transporter ATP-binding protein [Leptolyngbya sp. FACHB-541]MBD2054544.1 phosphonate ABC transporter ATP-binding protein [Oculatella sp. FACHB-28]